MKSWSKHYWENFKQGSFFPETIYIVPHSVESFEINSTREFLRSLDLRETEGNVVKTGEDPIKVCRRAGLLPIWKIDMVERAFWISGETKKNIKNRRYRADFSVKILSPQEVKDFLEKKRGTISGIKFGI